VTKYLSTFLDLDLLRLGAQFPSLWSAADSGKVETSWHQLEACKEIFVHEHRACVEFSDFILEMAHYFAPFPERAGEAFDRRLLLIGFFACSVPGCYPGHICTRLFRLQISHFYCLCAFVMPQPSPFREQSTGYSSVRQSRRDFFKGNMANRRIALQEAPHTVNIHILGFLRPDTIKKGH
jgi:hypothetical protein